MSQSSSPPGVGTEQVQKEAQAGLAGLLEKHPALPYVLPFAVFLLFLVIGEHLGLGRWEYVFRTVVLCAVLCIFSRKVIDLRVSQPVWTVLFGLAVCVVWVAPDLLWPGYRQHWLFQNAVMGQLSTSLNPAHTSDGMVLSFRAMRAVLLVPIIEELFWRGWLMRWLINNDFRAVPLGKYAPGAFWITAVLFASEHGPFWDVGLLAGIAYNYWIIRTRSLGDCILAHAVTNAALSAFVVATGRWEYWL